jgi:pimeloyl-ACP methyl ester carboxylesterase
MNKVIFCISFLISGSIAFAQNNQRGIDTIVTVSIGGIQQVFAVKGNNREKPLLLYLHGAVANTYSLITNANKLTSKLQEHFMVILWDQRDYGKTLELNQSTVPPTLKRIVDDTKEVVDRFLAAFGRKKLYIAGHARGSAMGIFIAHQYPQLLHALIEISPPVNGLESQELGWSMLKEHFRKINNEKAVKELSTVQPAARDFESLFTRFVWQNEYDGVHLSDTAIGQIKPVWKQWMETPAAALSNEVFQLNFFKLFPVLKCPVYFLVGRKDFMTNATLSEKYYQAVKAPKKQLFCFERAAHGVPDSEPEGMQDIIITKVLPETYP